MEDSSRPSLGVYSPYLQGFYFGELIGQIQQLCMIKGWDFHLIQTGGFAEYQCEILTSKLDFAVILRNAVHPELAEKLAKKCKAVVAIAYDYFPLDIPIASCDNELGVELAVNHLLSQGHNEFAYIGDLSQFDMRKRYEGFCEQLAINSIEVKEDNIFPVDNSLFSGGYDAAEEFIRRRCKAKAVVVGSGLTAIGFLNRLREFDEGLSDSISTVYFDALTVRPINFDHCAVVDQNLYLLAFRALATLEAKANGSEFNFHDEVEPKLIGPDSQYHSLDEAFLATSVEMSELHDPCYMKSLLNNFYEWPKHISESGLDMIMILAPLFPQYMQKAVLARMVHTEKGEFAKVTKVMTPSEAVDIDVRNRDSLCKTADYCPNLGSITPMDYSLSVHVPIKKRGESWGVLSIFGSNKPRKQSSSMVGLCGYLSSVVEYYSVNKFGVDERPIAQSSQEPAKNQLEGEIIWNVSENIVEWSDEALQLLGLNTPLEKNIYRNMDLTDRQHADDKPGLRNILSTEDKNITFGVRLKHKDKSYISFDFRCEKDNEAGVIRCHIKES
jgi:DNA-binding LacI/PurR family transcriptional regulator